MVTLVGGNKDKAMGQHAHIFFYHFLVSLMSLIFIVVFIVLLVICVDLQFKGC